MGDQKISALTNGDPALSTDQIPVDRSGVNRRVSAGSLASLASITSLAGVKGFTASSVASSFSTELGFAWLAGASIVPKPSSGGENGYWNFQGGVVPWVTDNIDMACLNHITAMASRFRPFFNSGKSDNQSWIGFTPRDGIAVSNPTLLFPAVPLTPFVGFKCRVPLGETNWQVYVSQDTSGTNVTQVDTGVTYDQTFHTFSFKVTGGGTSIEFFIDGVSKAVVTTNIPAANQPLSPVIYQESIARNEQVQFDTDGFWWAEV